MVASGRDSLVHSYLYLRRAIGLIGVALPFVLVLGNLLLTGEVLTSISYYYYSGLRDVYVGAMCAVGVFLLSYRGEDLVEDIVSDLAAVAAIGVALFPTVPAFDPSVGARITGVLHVVFAAVFFLSLAYFCLVRFRASDRAHATRRETQRDALYVTCGVAILACLAGIVLTGWLFEDALRDLRPVLVLETAGTLAFGLAWLTKGEAILGDVDREPATAAAGA